MTSPLLLVAYVLTLALLFAYGARCYVLVRLAGRARPVPPAPPLERLPRVTVQLPIFNERYVLPRLLDAMGALDWPRDALEVQVLDDSTDDTREMAARLVEEWRSRGLDVVHLHREDRRDYKAGALREGLRAAKGEFIAIFDADFVPSPDLLRRTVPALAADPKLACVQARWSHMNEDYSWLTAAQATGIDGHFVIEQRVRSDRGFLLNFNGTAGVWRRDAIADAGDWSGETVAEDLDLSYRAQLRGWRILYLSDVHAPAELPAQLSAFKRQQARWARGSIQCLRRHARAVLAHPTLRPAAKIEAMMHLSHYAVHPLMLALTLLLLPMVLTGRVPILLAGVLFGATFGPPTMYLAAQRALHPTTWRRRAWRLVPLTLLGIGIAASNTSAVLSGLVTRGGEFRRTPKFRLESRADSWRDKTYALGIDATTLVEGALAILMLVTAAIGIATRNYAVLPWAILLAASYGVVFATSLAQRIRRKEQGPVEAAHAAPT